MKTDRFFFFYIYYIDRHVDKVALKSYGSDYVLCKRHLSCAGRADCGHGLRVRIVRRFEVRIARRSEIHIARRFEVRIERRSEVRIARRGLRGAALWGADCEVL